jgi:intraflagellar transport protein 88
MYEEALECFWKVRNIVRYDPQTLYQIGHLYQLMNDVDQASEWYLMNFLNVICIN